MSSLPTMQVMTTLSVSACATSVPRKLVSVSVHEYVPSDVLSQSAQRHMLLYRYTHMHCRSEFWRGCYAYPRLAMTAVSMLQENFFSVSLMKLS